MKEDNIATTKQPKTELPAGTTGIVLTRLRGERRHVTIYPHHRGSFTCRETSIPAEEFNLHEADVLIKTMHWRRDNEYTELEPGVFTARAVKE